MPRAKTRKRVRIEMQSFVFEIKDWRPSYLLSVNHDRYRPGLYSEYVTIEFESTCVFPPALAGRPLRSHVGADRDFLEPSILRIQPDFKPRCVGLLDLPPTGGRFDFAVPFETMGMLLPGFAHGHYRYLSLWGPVLKRGKSLCTTLHLERSVDLDEL